MWNTVLFSVIPYVAVALAVVGGIWRYRTDRFSYSSQSSQFLESRALFWGSVSWHYGILLILGAHVIAVVLWTVWGALVNDQGRLLVLEVIGLAVSLLSLAGLAVLAARRLSVPRVRSVTSPMDWVLMVVLAVQVILGIWMSLVYRWGSEWYVHTSVPWLHSLVKLNPKPEFMVNLPWIVKAHAVLGFGLIALFPFTRLVHIVSAPVTYLWRSYQLVVWNRRAAQ
ncbi:MAG: respiratory nitrate reductase subunit gamma [Thermoleophilia bacterium]|nr:respiratory nitrate reductase subunit gamma [Thermoleophilia bacterium]